MRKSPRGREDEKPENPHDVIFRSYFSEPEVTERLLAEHAPKDVFAAIRPGKMSLVPGSFITDKMRQLHTDLLFKVELKTGDPAYVYLLLEHKSYSDPLIPLQLLCYKCNIWSSLNNRKPKPPLPPIYPIVFYHGARPWTAPRTFHDLFPPLDEAARFLTEQAGYVLIDLARIEDDKLSSDRLLRAVLTALKQVPRSDMRDVGLLKVVGTLVELEDVDIWRILYYILAQHDDISQDDLNRALLECAPERGNDIMRGWTRDLEAKGWAKGLAAGEAKGRAEGMAAALICVLTDRFGPLSAHMERRIRAADSPTLDRWLRRVAKARSPEDVIAH
jgi:predicted transposase/invertase (TIGR01784 family)